MKESDPWGLFTPCPGAMYMYMTIIFNIFCSETAWLINADFHVERPGEGGTKVYIYGPGHMTKMAATPIYGSFFNFLRQSQKSL